MKLTKRLLALFLILAAWLTLTACDARVDVNLTADSTTTSSSSALTTTTASTADSAATTTTAASSVTATTTTTTATAVGSTPLSTTTTTTTATTTTETTTTTTSALSADKALVDRAFRLARGERMENVTLTGVVTDSDGYAADYGNATFHLAVEGSDGTRILYCYRVKPADSARPEVTAGDRLTLSGTVQNYKGTIEFYPATYTHVGDGGTTASTASTASATRTTGVHAIDEDGIYDSKDDVALYLHVYGRLPKNFVTKSEYNSLGKPANKCCGGDRFYNKEGRLPNKSGRLYYECDIDTYGIKSRGAKRIVYSNDGLIYYTADHYETFTLLYGEP